jgi:hypothetical protein
MMKSGRRWAWASGLIGACVIIALGRPSLHLTLATLRDRQDRPLAARGSIDDASGLDETRVAEVWNIPADSVSAEKQLVALVQRGRAEGLAISIAGARHSMGGHSIRRDGIVINMLPFHGMQLDEARNILHVQAGARWSEIIPLLNARGRSVAVMQSRGERRAVFSGPGRLWALWGRPRRRPEGRAEREVPA